MNKKGFEWFLISRKPLIAWCFLKINIKTKITIFWSRSHFLRLISSTLSKSKSRSLFFITILKIFYFSDQCFYFLKLKIWTFDQDFYFFDRFLRYWALFKFFRAAFSLFINLLIKPHSPLTQKIKKKPFSKTTTNPPPNSQLPLFILSNPSVTKKMYISSLLKNVTELKGV